MPALVFHDTALWTHRAVDYAEPSSKLAREYLLRIERSDWIGPVLAIVESRHKQRPLTGSHAEYAEPLRRADLGDFTFGLQGGVPRSALQEGRQLYPNAGFHKMLMKRSLRRLLTRPCSPAPMLRR